MAEKKEQEKPLAPSAHRVDIDEPEPEPISSVEPIPRYHQKRIICCGCSAAILLILVTIILILMLTVLRVKHPILKMNSIKIDGVDVLNTSSGVHPAGLNLTVLADVSVKNPNVASFKFDNTTTYVYYDGSVVGEVKTPAGQARARSTLRMNVTIDVMVDKVMEVGRFRSDLVEGLLPISTYTRISGKVKITDAIQRSHVVVRMNCTMNVNISSQGIQDRNCRRRVSL